MMFAKLLAISRIPFLLRECSGFGIFHLSSIVGEFGVFSFHCRSSSSRRGLKVARPVVRSSRTPNRVRAACWRLFVSRLARPGASTCEYRDTTRTLLYLLDGSLAQDGIAVLCAACPEPSIHRCTSYQLAGIAEGVVRRLYLDKDNKILGRVRCRWTQH